MQAFDIKRPVDLLAAVSAGRGDGASYIAGGTDLMQLMKDNIAAPRHLVDVEAVLDDRVTRDGAKLRIGALARMSDVAAHPLVSDTMPVVSQALLASASPQLRNMATVGGNLLQRTRCGYFRDTGFACNKRIVGSGCPAIRGENRMHAILGVSDACIATHASDLAVALIALDASLELHSGDGGMRVVPLVGFHLEPGTTPNVETVLRPGELITAILLPVTPAARNSFYLKVRDRASFEFALVSAAVGLDIRNGIITEARVALGGVGTKPWRAPEAEAALRGKQANDDSFMRAAQAALQGARPARENGFKVVLAQRALVRALQRVSA